MNREQNDYNTQDNNGMPNNQTLQNNQILNPIFNQNVEQTTNVDRATFDLQTSVRPIQQPTPQPVDNTSVNVNNQNFNNKGPKKMNFGLIIATCFGTFISTPSFS